MKLRITATARREIESTIDYYDAQRQNLGNEFLSELEARYALILRFPESGYQLTTNIRRCSVNRFPYVVIYRFKGSDVIEILAVPHTRQMPRKFD